jgi:hypothetical protein
VTTTAPRCPACGAPAPPEPRSGKGRQPVYCGTSKCKQARKRRAAERREAVALLRLVADLAGYAAAQVGNGLSPADARAAIGEAAAEFDAAAAGLRRMGALAERRNLARLLLAQGMTGAQITARTGISEKTISRYRRG